MCVSFGAWLLSLSGMFSRVSQVGAILSVLRSFLWLNNIQQGCTMFVYPFMN